MMAQPIPHSASNDLRTLHTQADCTLSRVTFVCCLFLALAVAPNALAQTWTSNGPIARGGHSAVFDPSTSRMIVFGGEASETRLPPPQDNLNDVWLLTPAAASTPRLAASRSWHQLFPAGTSPSARFGHSAAYDPATNRMMIFGGAQGHTSPCANDVWVLTGANGNGAATWMQLHPSGNPPSPRWGQGGVYDPSTNTLIIFGGNDCFQGYFNDVWVLSHANGLGGNPSWTQLPTSAGPGARFLSGTVYDPASNTLILFGGEYGFSTKTYFNDVWALSHANRLGGSPTWTQLSPTGGPPAPRQFMSATYDPATNRMTIFGGGNSTGEFADAWILTNANGRGGASEWLQIAAASTDFPYPRLGHSAVYSPLTNEMVVFGGSTSTAALNDVFILSHANGQ